MSVDPIDFIHPRELSTCCGAPRLDPDFCSECHEHAEFTTEDNEADPADCVPRERTWPTPAEQDELDRLEAVQQRTHTTPHEL